MTPDEVDVVRLRILGVLERITHEWFDYELKTEYKTASYHVRVIAKEGCPFAKEQPWSGKWCRLSEHMADDEIIRTALRATVLAVKHETQKQFNVRNTKEKS